jgi:hypothetical protein
MLDPQNFDPISSVSPYGRCVTIPEWQQRWTLFNEHRIKERLSFSEAPLRFYPIGRAVKSLEHDYLVALVKKWQKHGGVIKEGPAIRMWEWQVVFTDVVRKHVDTLRNRGNRARKKAEQTGLRYFAYKALVSESERTYFKHTALPRPYPLVSECAGEKAEQLKERAAEPSSIKSGPFRHWDCEDRFLSRLFLPDWAAHLAEGWGDVFHQDYDSAQDTGWDLGLVPEDDKPARGWSAHKLAQPSNQLDQLFGQEVDQSKLKQESFKAPDAYRKTPWEPEAKKLRDAWVKLGPKWNAYLKAERKVEVEEREKPCNEWGLNEWQRKAKVSSS